MRALAQAAGLTVRSMGMPFSQRDWAKSPIYGFSFTKPPNDASTQVVVRSNASAAMSGSLGLCFVHHRLVKIAYGEDGLAQAVNIVENLA